MANVSKFVIGSTEIDVKDTTARSNASTNATSIGTLSSLTTTTKTDLVSAINEVNGSIPSGASYDSTTETISL